MRLGLYIAGVCAIAAAATATGALAQPAGGAPPPPRTGPPCPANGFMKPYFAFFGDNDGVTRAYEIANSCVGAEVRAAADALGMARYSPLGVKHVSTLRFKATGVFADGRGPARPGSIDMNISYAVPGARLVVERPGAKPQVMVFADGQAWNETAPGVGGVLANNTLRDRAPLLKLTPHGALWSLIEAEGTAKVSKDAQGRTVISGASPYDNYLVTATLNADNRPVIVEVQAEGRRWRAEFENYRGDLESDYLVRFPDTIRWSVDGRPLANLKVTHFRSNGFVIFPPPARQARR